MFQTPKRLFRLHEMMLFQPFFFERLIEASQLTAFKLSATLQRTRFQQLQFRNGEWENSRILRSGPGSSSWSQINGHTLFVFMARGSLIF